MAEQKKVKKQTTEKTTEVVEVKAKTTEGAEELKDELDDLLDEIDSVLEENAEEFIRNYVQKGGQAREVLLSAWYNIKDGYRQTKLRVLGEFNEGLQGIRL